MEDASDDISAPAAESQQQVSTAGLFLGMVSFWAILLLAAIIFAAVALAPGALRWFQLRDQVHQNASQMLRLERDVEQLSRIRTTLETDADYRRQQVAKGSPLDRQLDAVKRPPERRKSLSAAATVRVFGPGGAEILGLVGRDPSLRRTLLWIAALMVLIAFTFLNPAGGSVLWSLFRVPANSLRRLQRRYSSAGDAGFRKDSTAKPEPGPSTTTPELKLYSEQDESDAIPK